MKKSKEVANKIKLIAVFEGYQQVKEFETLFIHPTKKNLTISEFKYDSSMDWLMPVLERIEAMGYKTIIGGGDSWGNYCNINYGISLMESSETKAMGQGDTKMEAIFEAVAEFIEWYNKKKDTL